MHTRRARTETKSRIVTKVRDAGEEKEGKGRWGQKRQAHPYRETKYTKHDTSEVCIFRHRERRPSNQQIPILRFHRPPFGRTAIIGPPANHRHQKTRRDTCTRVSPRNQTVSQPRARLPPSPRLPVAPPPAPLKKPHIDQGSAAPSTAGRPWEKFQCQACSPKIRLCPWRTLKRRKFSGTSVAAPYRRLSR